MSHYILDQLDWSVNAKNQCAKNVRTAFKVPTGLGDARQWEKYCDVKNPEIGFVAVMGKNSPGLNEEGKKYGHVAVVTEIDVRAKKVRIFDGPNAFHFWTPMINISGYISPEKMMSLGSKINFFEKKLSLLDNIVTNITPNPTSNKLDMGYYEEIFNRQYPNGGTIYKDLKNAKEKFGDLAFFIAIGLERASGNKNI